MIQFGSHLLCPFRIATWFSKFLPPSEAAALPQLRDCWEIHACPSVHDIGGSNQSCRALVPSRHRPLWAGAGGAMFGWAPLQGSVFPLYNNLQVLTFLNKFSEEKEIAWRETIGPEVGLGDKRKSPLCNSEPLSFSWHCTGHTNPWQAGATVNFLINGAAHSPTPPPAQAIEKSDH